MPNRGGRPRQVRLPDNQQHNCCCHHDDRHYRPHSGMSRTIHIHVYSAQIWHCQNMGRYMHVIRIALVTLYRCDGDFYTHIHTYHLHIPMYKVYNCTYAWNCRILCVVSHPHVIILYDAYHAIKIVVAYEMCVGE